MYSCRDTVTLVAATEMIMMMIMTIVTLMMIMMMIKTKIIQRGASKGGREVPNTRWSLLSPGIEPNVSFPTPRPPPPYFVVMFTQGTIISRGRHAFELFFPTASPRIIIKRATARWSEMSVTRYEVRRASACAWRTEGLASPSWKTSISM